MKPNKFIQAVKDCGQSRQERMFRMMVLVGMGGLAAAIIIGVVLRESVYNCIVMMVAFALFGIIFYFAVSFQRVQLGAVAIGVIMLFFVLPFNFLTTGGIYGGGPVWLMFGMVYVCLVVEGRIKYIFYAGSVILSAVCYYVSYFYPGLLVQHTTGMAYLDSFFTLCIVTTVTCAMILFQNSIYHSENETAKAQKKEIEELNQAQNRFFSSMSHEIRTPVNTIIGLNEMILREAVSAEVAADAKSIQGASKMLLTLINDILDMSKLESGKMEIIPVPYDVGAMLSDIVNMIWVRAREKGLEFHIDVDQEMPAQLFGDEVRIKQILINVLNNAVKYTPEGSVTLSIQCKRTEPGRALVSYSVTDTGMGIKKENIPYLFSVFKRVDVEKNRYVEGTGLGLSIVKQLVDLMGGDIAVNSVYTRGSTFVVTLPQEIVGEAPIGALDLEKRHVLNEREHYKQSFEAPKAQVLVVDDNEANLMVAEKLLRDTKVRVSTASSGKECLQKTLRSRYDAILMDHLMPEMDGIECLHAIRAQTGGLNRETPVVILTANAGGENQALYRREGFDGYLLKPVSGAQLEAELVRHLPRALVSATSAAGKTGVVETPVLAHRKKAAVLISTDSVCDLPRELLEKYQVAVIPYRVFTEGGEFMDGVEIETDGVLSYMDKRGKHAWSEAPGVKDYEEFFAAQLARAQHIIHIAMARNVGQGCANAMEAARTFDNVTVVDSGHLSSGLGLMVLRAAGHAVDGMTHDAIINELEQVKGKIRTSFIVDTTKYLVQSMRISSRVNTLCRMLMLHPVIVLKNSRMAVSAVHTGTKDSARRKYVMSALDPRGEVDRRILFITHAGLTREELAEIEEQVTRTTAFEHIICQKVSPAAAANCGPGTVGLLFMMK